MAIGEAAAVVTTLKSASELIDRLRKTDDRDELRNGVSQLAGMLLDARAAALQLLEDKAQANDELRTAKAEVRRLSDFDEKASRFERILVNKIFVYRERNASGSNSRLPYFCPNCFGQQRISLLQDYGDSCYHCQTCEKSVYL